MTDANDKPAELKPHDQSCAICDQRGADRNFYGAVSAPSTSDVVYFRAWCCGDCFEKIAQNQSTAATLGKAGGAIMVAGMTTLYFLFPGVPIRHLIFMALVFCGVCFGVGYMIYQVATPPKPRPKDSELEAFAKRLSRQHLRDATPSLELLATPGNYPIVDEFIMPPHDDSDQEQHDA